MPSHQGKTALVTGGGAGLGLAIVQRLLKEGANVVVLELSEENLKTLDEKVRSSFPGRLLAIQGSVVDQAKLSEVFSEAQDKFQQVDYVVNSCGVIDNLEPVGELSRDVWDKVIAVNLTAPTMVTQLAVNAFLKRKVKGAIVNISSLAAIKGFIAGTAYSVSKAGLVALTKSTAAAYWQQGIRCNAILAGPMSTNIGSTMVPSSEGIRIMQRTYPDMGPGQQGINDLEDVTNLVSYLCSEDSAVLNGAAVPADGGCTAFQ